ncbi:hypothetical protein GCK72_021341 [Caenorhabditis remanei]|uniref:F-box domain-containing protein n=1 Tax=Caenorhabditis remanei TaxID=31234 RepID=A0A6A5GHW0_CAERE|nr:hypothetical protein GCK72_021341 [Caenorhabditis remanei]KAF1754777.1 hypothetical protein GCK72_021341 [Caenorhabditis remanei]
MAGWSQLPPEIKQHVVKKLDFMSRHALKSTSYTNRLIVNSTSLYLPRVRFGYQRNRCLIVIYTGVERFLRWEFVEDDDDDGDGGITVYRSENTYDSAHFHTKSLPPQKNLLRFGITCLKTLLSHDSILIQSFEWNVSLLDALNMFPSKLIDHLGGAVFRARETVFSKFTGSNEHYRGVFRKEDLKACRQFVCCVSASSLKPVMVHDTCRLKDGLKFYVTTISLDTLDDLDDLESFNESIEDYTRLDDKSPFYFSFRGGHLIKKGQTSNRIVSDDGAIVDVYQQSSCGQSRFKMLKIWEELMREEMESEKCGLGWMCTKCSAPFEYWYHQNLPRRFYLEPFWRETFISLDVEDNDKMYALIEQDEARRRKQRIQKAWKPSWGFRMRQIGFQNRAQKKAAVKNQKQKMNRKMKKLWRKENKNDVIVTKKSLGFRIRMGIREEIYKMYLFFKKMLRIALLIIAILILSIIVGARFAIQYVLFKIRGY